jgi:hypothetical protein
MKTKEQKLSDDFSNAVEDHWFNPSILAHLLSNQPHFTIDRLVEVVAHLIRFNSERYKADFKDGITSEGLFMANELNTTLTQLIRQYDWKNLSLPVSARKVINSLPEPEDTSSKYSWLHAEQRNPFYHMNVISQ